MKNMQKYLTRNYNKGPMCRLIIMMGVLVVGWVQSSAIVLTLQNWLPPSLVGALLVLALLGYCGLCTWLTTGEQDD